MAAVATHSFPSVRRRCRAASTEKRASSGRNMQKNMTPASKSSPPLAPMVMRFCVEIIMAHTRNFTSLVRYPRKKSALRMSARPNIIRCHRSW